MKTLLRSLVLVACFATPAFAVTPFEQYAHLTCTEAWEIANRDTDAFVDLVDMFARNSVEQRGVVIPDTEEAGAALGNAIMGQVKDGCTKEPDSLLYSQVNKGVMDYAAQSAKK